MSFRPYDIIVNKRDGKTHNYDEIEYFINGYTTGRIPDYQVSAWLMAVFLNGLTEEETFYLTKAMINSGKIIDLHSINKPKIDKHSTGGVGDKVSLILAPAAAACGIIVPMTSGRGLGFTGGTLDKLESIPGFNVHLSEGEFKNILEHVGYAMTGQTETLAPADKKLYALRDVTGTVENISMITASILSKKIAEGADSIVMDVKCGSGAFTKNIEESRKLARSLSSIAALMGKKVTCVISNMDQPLGRAVGNSLEVIESIKCMRGKGEPDVVDLVAELGGHMLLNGGIVDSVDKGKSKIKEKLNNGEAFDKFIDSVRSQGGNLNFVKDLGKLPHANFEMDVEVNKSGFIRAINTESVGTAAIFLGAGRLRKEDPIDPAPGIIVHKKLGDEVNAGDRVATIYYNDEGGVQSAVKLLQESYEIDEEKPSKFKLILEVIE
jgi:pyrimidine-nucleoside phosphorylase